MLCRSEIKDKLKSLMDDLNLDAMILCSPENIYYATGFSPHQLTVSRMPGFAYAVITKEKDEKSYLITMDYEAPAFESVSADTEIVSYDTWVGVKSRREFADKKNILTNKEFRSSIEVLRDLIGEINLQKSSIGIECDFISTNHYNKLSEIFDKVMWHDVSEKIIELRSVKTPYEIDIFRELTNVCDEALLEMSKNVNVGANVLDLISIYRKNCLKNNISPSNWSMLGCGADSSVLKLPNDEFIKNGDSLRFDGGCEANFRFYKTDFSRSWLVGEADEELVRTKRVLYNAQRLMIEKLKPGMTFDELFKVGFDYVKSYIPNYRRGHLGHSISLGPQTADKPFIAPGEMKKIKAGMILCVEVPFYVKSYNGFNIEDMILVNDSGCEVLTYRTPHFLKNEMQINSL